MKTIIYLEVGRRDTETGDATGYRTHLITMSNGKAAKVVEDFLTNLTWLDTLGLENDDFCVWDGE